VDLISEETSAFCGLLLRRVAFRVKPVGRYYYPRSGPREFREKEVGHFSRINPQGRSRR
jgi:hypothetical protein